MGDDGVPGCLLLQGVPSSDATAQQTPNLPCVPPWPVERFGLWHCLHWQLSVDGHFTMADRMHRLDDLGSEGLMVFFEEAFSRPVDAKHETKAKLLLNLKLCFTSRA
mmetsp:Transcript_29534/g.53655  ORF Transcript_29534/g.53655 Transcript_29534/m.53655 type:complete len:107 (-) Transcript_29534:93-413(-)